MDKETMTTNFGLSRTLRRTNSQPNRTEQPSRTEQPNRTVRIVMLGQAAVGKTALAVRFITKRFIGEYDPTLETIYSHGMAVGGDLVQLEILDTAGQEEDALLMEEKIRWGDAFVVVYSVTDRCSFHEVARLCFLVNHTHTHSSSGSAHSRHRGGSAHSDPRPPPPTAIVANKKDLSLDRMVTAEEGAGLSRGLGGGRRFWEVSARDGWEEPTAVFHALYGDVVRLRQQIDLGSAPSSAAAAAGLRRRHRPASRLMDRIPRISSGPGPSPGPAPSGPPPRPPLTLPRPPLTPPPPRPTGHAPRSFSLGSFLPD